MVEHESDELVLQRIRSLENEQHSLYGKSDWTDHDRVRLEKLKVELDQSWDLLRQRRARREFGQDPDDAQVRPASVVENYEQ